MRYFLILLYVLVLFLHASEKLNIKLQAHPVIKIIPACSLGNSEAFGDSYRNEYFYISIQNESLLEGTVDNRTIKLIADDFEYILSRPSTVLHSYDDATTGQVDQEALQTISNAKSLKIIVEYTEVIKKKVEDREKSYLVAEYAPSAEEYITPRQYFRSVVVTKKISYPIKLDKHDIEEAMSVCHNEIASAKKNKIIFEIMIVVGIFVGLFLFYKIIHTLIKKSKLLAIKTSNRMHEYRVQKIAEDEAIRATVNKAVKENDDELGKLQDLINNAVAKGDTETAKALVEILEKKKGQQ